MQGSLAQVAVAVAHRLPLAVQAVLAVTAADMAQVAVAVAHRPTDRAGPPEQAAMVAQAL
jgi:hypothetical protein